MNNEDGDTIVKNRLMELGKWKNSRSLDEQASALKKFLRKPSNKHFSIGSMVMKDIGSDSKSIEKGYSLKVKCIFLI